MPTVDVPVAPPPPLLPDTDDPIRSLLGDDYPENVILLYLPQRLSHAFTADAVSEPPRWTAAFLDDNTARSFALGVMHTPHPLRHPLGREVAEPHQYSLGDACSLVQNLYPASPGLLILHPDGRRVRHYVR